MGRRTFNNALISSDTFTDLAGNEDMSLANAGELEIPTTPFMSRQQLNIDGTLTAMPVQDAKLSYEIYCDVCGIPIKTKKELVKQKGKMRCKNCIDEES